MTRTHDRRKKERRRMANAEGLRFPFMAPQPLPVRHTINVVVIDGVRLAILTMATPAGNQSTFWSADGLDNLIQILQQAQSQVRSGIIIANNGQIPPMEGFGEGPG